MQQYITDIGKYPKLFVPPVLLFNNGTIAISTNFLQALYVLD